MKFTIYTILIFLFTFQVSAQEGDRTSGKEYPDGEGGTVYLPLGDASFADAVVSNHPGEIPPDEDLPAVRPEYTLGVPDYTKPSAPGFLSLGCDGSVVLQFTDNILIDVEGPDLYVFEVGPAVEPTLLEISYDGKEWIDVGKIEGARADVDIAPFVKENDVFNYVRLTNAGKSCGGRTPGADIDAVAAVGSGYRLSLNSAVLFDLGEAVLQPEAKKELDAIAMQIKEMPGNMRVVVEGHTDNIGTPQVNEELSIERAQAVWDELSKEITIDEELVSIQGRGESRPVANNDTEEGRALNRRVDILILPDS
ncbi:OmpA family protein [Salinimicrobium terrae]|uniref:OmpA family protein n=1 Tax=Salinimicrobium terrae TaxID=470866 RepID=UPI0004104C1F|nr:OmpA family protein [Salinimicrobium terrae]